MITIMMHLFACQYWCEVIYNFGLKESRCNQNEAKYYKIVTCYCNAEIMPGKIVLKSL